MASSQTANRLERPLAIVTYFRRMSVHHPNVRRVLSLLAKPGYDAPSAIELLKRADADGDGEAAYALGTWHLFGKHVPKDYKRAAGYLKRAADRDYPSAAFDLAISYEKGAGVKQDAAKAFGLYMKASLLGDRDAMYEVGRCFYWGIGTEKDRHAAKVWFDAHEQFDERRSTRRKAVRRTPLRAA